MIKEISIAWHLWKTVVGEYGPVKGTLVLIGTLPIYFMLKYELAKMETFDHIEKA